MPWSRCVMRAASAAAVWSLSVLGAQPMEAGAAEWEEIAAFCRETSIRIKENYDRIRTWKATYRFEDAELHSAIGQQRVPPYLRKITGTMEWLCDFQGNRLFAHWAPDSNSFRRVDPATGKDLGAAATTAEFLGVRTPAMFLELRPGLSPPVVPDGKGGFINILGIPPEGGKYIDKWGTDHADKASVYGVYFNPQVMWHFGGLPVYVYLSHLSEVLEVLVDERESACDLQRDGDTWVLIQWSSSRTNASVLRFDDSPTRNWLGGYHELHGTKRFTWTIKYGRQDGISIPTEFYMSNLEKDGQLDISRHVRLVSSQLNVPVSDSDFSYKALGVGNGTRMVDRATSEIKVLLDGKWLSVADYNRAYQTRREKRSSAKLAAVLAAYGAAAVGLCAIVIWRLRRRRK